MDKTIENNKNRPSCRSSPGKPTKLMPRSSKKTERRTSDGKSVAENKVNVPPSQTTQTLKSKKLSPAENIKPFVEKFDTISSPKSIKKSTKPLIVQKINQESNLNQIKSTKPLVGKIDKEILQSIKSNSSQGQWCRSNMKNMSRKFLTLVKQNALENKSIENKKKEDLHLIKGHVSVDKIKRVLMQMSKSSTGITERTSLQRTYTTVNQSSVANKNELVSEFLETVMKKRLSLSQESEHNQSKKMEITHVLRQKPNISNRNKSVCVSKKENLILEPEEIRLKQNALNSGDVTLYSMFSIERTQEEIEKEIEEKDTSCEEMFQPKFYMFRLPASNAPPSNCPIMARPPIFSVLLDNFIAVIWELLKYGNIGINSLQWTYELLKILKYKNGVTPDIVEEFKAIIQDKLIASYAEFYELREKNENELQQEQKRRKMSMISLTSSKKNKWVNSISLMKSFSLREIVKRGRNSIGKPTEDDKLVIKSLIPTATILTHQSHSNSSVVDNTEAEDNPSISFLESKGMNLEEIKAMLSKMRKTHAEKLQQELSSIKKIENFLVKVDKNFKPTMTYESAQIVTSNEKIE